MWGASPADDVINKKKGGGINVAKLTTKQKVFADEYIKNGGNATQAAITAGYSKKTARTIAVQNLAKVNIKDYLQARLKPIEEKRNVSADEALNELIDIWKGETITSYSKQIDRLNDNEVKKDMQYEFTPDVESRLKALDLYLKYKSLLSQTQLKKIEAVIKVLEAKLESTQETDERIVFVEPDELMKQYMEGNSHEYENVDK